MCVVYTLLEIFWNIFIWFKLYILAYIKRIANI